MFTLSNYQYNLPEEKIAQFPVIPRDACKLLVCEKNQENNTYSFFDQQFSDIAGDLTENDVLFFNNTNVIKARVPLTNVRVVTHVWREVVLENAEFFLLQKIDDMHCECLVSLLKRTRVGMKIYPKNNNDLSNILLEIVELNDRGVVIRMSGISVDEFFWNNGQLPLPPYITTSDEERKKKEANYQTVFAHNEGQELFGSVAAPTAALHFTNELLQTVQEQGVGVEYVRLHVWLGTFKPIDTADIRDYHIHTEDLRLSPDIFTKLAIYKQQGKRVIAVGTTVARTIESLPHIRKILKNNNDLPKNILESQDVVQFRDTMTQKISLEQAEEYIPQCHMSVWASSATPSTTTTVSSLHVATKIFIYPGFQWRIVGSLITNFHVPGSSLLTLVASAMGFENMKMAYEYALSHDYRFLSFGDAMRIKEL